MDAVLRPAALALAFLVCARSARASVEISSAATQNMNCNAGICSPTSKNAVLNVNDLTNMLAAGDVKITTGNGAVTIGIVSPLAWASTHRLTLDANLNVNIKAPVMVEGTAGLTIVTNDGGTGGDLVFYPGGKIDFWDTTSRLIINGNRYTLKNDVQGLARAITTNTAGYFALAKDYDANGDGTYRGTAIPALFSGTFEGLGHAITNLSFRSARKYVGLFWDVSGCVRDIRLSNVLVSVVHNAFRHGAFPIGTLAASNGGTIVNASAEGQVTVTGNNYSVGGLVGASGGRIVNSSASVNIASGDRSNVGGLVGAMGDGEILDSEASGNISAGPHSRAGGLVGLAYGPGSSLSIIQSFARGNVTAPGNLDIGGLVGRAEYGLSVSDSYASGAVQTAGGSHIGGLFGYASHLTTKTSYSTSLVSDAGHAHHGGYIGSAYVTELTADYWDLNTSGQRRACAIGDCSGVSGLTDAQLKLALPAGFDPKVWGQSPSINNGYPYLLANPPPQ